MAESVKSGKLYPHVQPSKKAVQSIKSRITELTKRARTIMPCEWIVNEVNATVCGWAGYFHYRNSSKTLTRIRGHVEEQSEIVRRDTSCFVTGLCTRGTGSIKCRHQPVGRKRMLCSEEHRKAVCGKTARTV